ncbi:MAG: glycosyltransferase [Spirochaetales bacterium]|nr:glycosyltransferase [Spirochaetales bacterium]
MRILEILGEPLSNGGQESFLFNTLKYMNQTGMQFDVLTPYYADNEGYINQIKDNGGCVVAFNLSFNPGGSRWHIYKPLDKYLKNNNYDCVHIHSGSIFALMVCALVAKKNKITKIIVHSHASGSNKNLKYRLIKIISSIVFQYSDVVYCACSEIAGEWKFNKKVVNNKLIILKNGIDCNKFKFDEKKRLEKRAELNIDNNCFVIGNVGRLSNQKNQVFLIKVFELIHKSIPNSKLFIIGSGELEKELNELTNKMNLTDSVIFFGPTPHVNEYLNAMDFFVFPSLYEGYPISIVEAQCNGLPVLLSNSITKTAKLLDSVTFMELNQGADMWASFIKENINCKRVPNSYSEILKAGYDINDTAEAMRQLYIGDRR